MRVAPLSIAGLVLLAACASAPDAPLAARGAVIVSAAPLELEPPVSSLTQPARANLSSVEDLRVPNERSCLLKARTLAQVVLRLQPDGLDFALVTKVTDARVHVTTDPVGTGLIVELDSGPVALAGITPAANMAIYAKQPITLGGFFLPAGDTRLHITGSSKDRVLLEVAHVPFELRDLTTMLRNDVPCSVASLIATPIDARAALGRAVGLGYLLGDAVPLSLTANGEPVATLVPGLPAAEILERVAGAARIVWRVDAGYVSGWVPASKLGATRAPGDSHGRGFGRGTGRSRGRPSDRRVCDHDVPLGMKLGEEARIVGRVRARTLIELWGPLADGVAEVTVPAAEIHTLNGASSFVRSADILGCTRAPAELR